MTKGDACVSNADEPRPKEGIMRTWMAMGLALAMMLAAAPAGAAAWQKCKVCHNFNDKAKVGPGLGKGPN
ncbi:MAG: hypothetical protein D6771_07025, partial [Zetaproteobacteria bacterium]